MLAHCALFRPTARPPITRPQSIGGGGGGGGIGQAEIDRAIDQTMICDPDQLGSHSIVPYPFFLAPLLSFHLLNCFRFAVTKAKLLIEGLHDMSITFCFCCALAVAFKDGRLSD